jgi:transaldolase
VKDPNYDPTMYVTKLIAAHTVNTMPEATLNAVIAAGKSDGDSISPNFKNARALIGKLALLGIDFERIFNSLEQDGVKKFETSWNELIATVNAKVGAN